LYALIARPQPTKQPLAADDAPEPRFHWLGWMAGGFVVLGVVIVAAGFVNGERTMTSANTRWPVWVWTEGPFPGKQTKP
jgi:hypothetical protein